MIIRTQINCKIAEDNKWCIVFYDENGVINLCAIPPTSGDRIDVYLQTSLDFFGLHKKTEYIYNYQGNLKKLKGEKIIIRIKSGKVNLEYKK